MLITLKALTYRPTGGIVAAATTSLPEDIGGVRNWDYRYCWLRDATITLEALLGDRLPRGGKGLASAGRAARSPGIRKTSRSCTGWPGNAAGGVGGDLAARLRELGTGAHRQCGVGPAPAGRVRGGHRRPGAHFRAGLYDDRHTWSLQRALLGYLGTALGPARRGAVGGPRPPASLRALQGDGLGGLRPRVQVRGPRRREGAGRQVAEVSDEINREVCEKGYDAARGAFVQYYGASEFDAAVLLISDVGFLPADDPRVMSTMEALQRDLMQGGFMRRYELPGGRQVGGGRAGGLGGSLPGVQLLAGEHAGVERQAR